MNKASDLVLRMIVPCIFTLTTMLAFAFTFVFTFTQFHTCALAQTDRTSAPDSPLLGKIALAELRRSPSVDWFDTGYNNYTPAKPVVAALREKLRENVRESMRGNIRAQVPPQITFQIFMGTWCGDSKREVPRLIKVLHEAGVPDASIEIICVSGADSTRKRSPAGEERGLGIYRVPTTRVLTTHVSAGVTELGRIVEFPVESTERDVLAILTDSGRYSPNYRTFPIIGKWLQTGVLTDTNVSVAGLAAQLRFIATSETELNGTAYVLLANGQIREALTLFRVNTTLYPLSANCFDSLAECYEKAGTMGPAASAYQRAFELDPKNTSYIAKILAAKAANAPSKSASKTSGTP